MDEWRAAVSAKGREPPKGAYATGIRTTDERYKRAIQRVLSLTEAAYLETSEPAPHPVWWKRLLRRPYRRGDPEAFAAALHRIANERE